MRRNVDRFKELRETPPPHLPADSQQGNKDLSLVDTRK